MLAVASRCTAKTDALDNSKKIKKSCILKSDRKKSRFQETDSRMNAIHRAQIGMVITRCMVYAGIVVAVVGGVIKALFF